MIGINAVKSLAAGIKRQVCRLLGLVELSLEREYDAVIGKLHGLRDKVRYEYDVIDNSIGRLLHRQARLAEIESNLDQHPEKES